MKINKTTMILSIVILVLLIICFVTWKNNQTTQIALPSNFPDVTQPTTENTTPPNDTMSQAVNLPKDTGIVSTSTNGMLLYTNEKVGISFLFPRGWHLGDGEFDNRLGYSGLHIANYNMANYSGKGFSSDGKINKIGASIVTDNKYVSSGEYPNEKVKEQTLEISGQKIYRADVEFQEGQVMRTYSIPVPNQPGKFLGISIFGGTSNFYVLDNLVKSIQWVK